MDRSIEGENQTYIGPSIKFFREPRSIVQNRPINDGDEERKGDDGGVEEGVQGLKRARPAIEPRSTFEGIDQGMGACNQAVEEDSPKGQHGEVAELASDQIGTVVDAVIYPMGQLGGETVEKDKESKTGEQDGWQQP